MIRLNLRATRTLALSAMLVLWMLAQTLATGALAALDEGQWFSLFTSAGFGGLALYCSWRCWVAWCWMSQVRPMAHYR